ncbi:Isochorismatase hydrolase [Metschnikowia bicuspidata]|uniref:nicotinamidase n=1 Tax=Metschnikowia bicuspidata TaxID=27322 RepID=A0A4P9ZDI6_9ASCO|nr:Isochorismatase hydrolase [Metschnikowia bicuspidata]
MLKAALLIIDVQEDFLPPNGALAVPNGRAIIDKILSLCDVSRFLWLAIALTQDWHPTNHILFASQHNVEPFTNLEFEHPGKEKNACTGKIKCKRQTVWPDHCVQKTKGSEIEPSILATFDALPAYIPKLIVQKGYLQDREYYLCFSDVWHLHKTELEDFLLQNEISHIVVVGLAYDYCVLHSAVDSLLSRFSTAVIKDCCLSVHPEKIKETEQAYQEAGVQLFATMDDFMASLQN